MNTYIEKAKELLAAEQTDLIDFLTDIYSFCEKRENINEARIKQYMWELEEQCKNLCFTQRNAISCTCYALCTEYEYAAFTDGLQKGASLILNLLQGI